MSNRSMTAAKSAVVRSTTSPMTTHTAPQNPWSRSANSLRATKWPSCSVSSARPVYSATAKYLRSKKVPSIAIISGSSKFTNVANYPLTTTGLVSYDTEGKIYAKYLSKALPNGKYAILYQNDDLGKDYVNAFKAFFGKEFDRRVVTASL